MNKKTATIPPFKEFMKTKGAFGTGLVLAFGIKNIINSLVKDILSPLLINFIGKNNINSIEIHFAKYANIRLGHFTNDLISLTIMILIVYLSHHYIKNIKD